MSNLSPPAPIPLLHILSKKKIYLFSEKRKKKINNQHRRKASTPAKPSEENVPEWWSWKANTMTSDSKEETLVR